MQHPRRLLRAAVRYTPLALLLLIVLLIGVSTAVAQRTPSRTPRRAPSPVPAEAQLNDVHLHLTNYVQEGISMRAFLDLMGTRVGRAAVFGIPLQQQWSHRISGDNAPTYYLDTDARLYYYSFTDAVIATDYLSLSKAQQARLDPMITGFNPTDMYAADHIRRVLETFPGVFSGIGEFTIHKEFVSGKVAGDVASLKDPALDRILDFAKETGLLVLLHNDLTVPFAERGEEPVYLDQFKALLKRHPNVNIIWAHVGLGRVIQPVEGTAALVETLITDPALSHLYFDLSWEETAKYLVSSPEAVAISAELINNHPDRFLFGTDEVAPTNRDAYLEIYDRYTPLLNALTPEAREKVLKTNYVRLFDEARRRVRAWERENVTSDTLRATSR